MKTVKILFVLIVAISFNLYPQQDDKITLGEKIKIKSKVLNENREIFISLPAAYSPESSYPVFYVLDGETHFQYAAGVANFLAVNGRAQEAIVVAIPNTNRNRDLTPVSTTAIPNSGGGENFFKFLKNELIPYVDSKYNTQPYKILFGHSLAGMFTIYTLLSYPDMFNSYIAASPYVIYENNYVVNLAKEKKDNSFKSKKNLYITIGNEPDYFVGLNDLTEIFKSNFTSNFDWKYSKRPDENHGTIPLKTIYDGLEAIYLEWRLPENFAETGDLAKLKEHYDKLSSEFGYKIKAAERVVNIIGYQLMGLGKIGEALKIFEYNIELYPWSANVYDSYGEGLERAGKPELAQKNYSVAVKIGTEKNDPNLTIFKQHLDDIQKKISN